MASSLPPVKGAAFTFDMSLVSVAAPDVFQTSVTLAAGDITVSKSGGDFANITTLPTEIGTTGVLPVALSTTEMDADRVTVRFHDAAGAEWQDALVTLFTAAQTLDTSATELGKVPKSDSNVSWNATALAALQQEATDALEAALADSIPADGSRPSVKQALYMIVQRLTEVGIVGTTLTVYKVDGTTPLFTILLGDATNPTTQSRAT